MEAPAISANQKLENPMRGFRLPKGVWESLKREADGERRSATAQLIVILEERYAEDDSGVEKP